MKLNPKFARLFIGIILIGFIASGCALSHHAYYFSIDRPYSGQTLPSGTTITLQWHITGDQWPIPNAARYEVQIFDNFTVYTRNYAPFYGNAPGFTFPSRATDGLHLLSAKARVRFNDNTTSDWWQTPVNCVYVGTPPATYDPSTCSSTQNQGYNANQRPFDLVVTFTPSPTPVPVIDSVQAYPNPIYYGDTCPSVSTVTFRAALTLPPGTTPDLTTVQAHVSVRVGAGGTTSGNLLVNLLPDGSTDTASGGQVFLGTVALTHSYHDALNNFDLASLEGGSGALLWYVDASRHDPSSSAAVYLGKSPNQVLNLSPCPTNGHNPAHNSNGSAPATGCGQYSNQTSCNLAGCSWNPQNSSCSVNP